MNSGLDTTYERAGYHNRQDWGQRPALVLVDFARAYFEADSPLFGGDGCVSAANHAVELLENARAASIPVIFTEVRYKKGGQDGGIFFRKVPPLKCFEDEIRLEGYRVPTLSWQSCQVAGGRTGE